MRRSWDLTESLRCWGDGRVLMFSGWAEQVRLLAEQTGSGFVDRQLLRRWLGGGPAHPGLSDFPRAGLLAPQDKVIFPAYLGGDMVGHHGGITPKNFSFRCWSHENAVRPKGEAFPVRDVHVMLVCESGRRGPRPHIQCRPTEKAHALGPKPGGGIPSCPSGGLPRS